jgi:hypothetical protein
MSEHIIALLKLFQAFMPDQETAAWVLELAASENKWNGAHDLFDKVRRRNLAAIESGDLSRQWQYCFEEICLKALYNESGSRAPFDSDSPYWIAPLAIQTARQFGVPVDSVIGIVAPR